MKGGILVDINESKISYKVIAPSDISDYYVTEQPSATQLLRGIYYEDGVTANQIYGSNLSDLEKFILTLAMYENEKRDKSTILTMIQVKKQEYVDKPIYFAILTKLEERIKNKQSMLEKDFYLDYNLVLEQIKNWRTQSEVSGRGRA
ncbi:MAG: hypothetical protein ACLUFU_04435 [Bacilli bacterium]